MSKYRKVCTACGEEHPYLHDLGDEQLCDGCADAQYLSEDDDDDMLLYDDEQYVDPLTLI